MNGEHYHLTKLDFEEFKRELDAVWSDIQDPESNISAEARTKGIDISSLRGLKREETISFERQESGFDVTAIVMAFVAHGVVEVAKAAWVHLILPRIKRDLGDDAIQPTEPNT